ncbi:hypothetical protein TNCV_4462531 [Trichonephila clavipes]|nr:hypothetical protein TNCV_4462531 [Trichonephila clavipes]
MSDLASLMKPRQTLNKFRFEVLEQPPYNPDLSPRNLHICESLKKSITGDISIQTKKGRKQCWTSSRINHHLSKAKA